MKTLLLFLLICILSISVESCGTVSKTQCESIVETFSTVANVLCQFVSVEISAKSLTSYQAESLSTSMLMHQILALKNSMYNATYTSKSDSRALSTSSMFSKTIATLDSVYLALMMHSKKING